LTVTRAPAEPREGLPPCLSMTTLDDRLAILLDMSVDCGGRHLHRLRFEVAAGTAGERTVWPSHPDMDVTRCCEEVIDICTDDPDEAKAAFKRGAEWVRTGEGP